MVTKLRALLQPRGKRAPFDMQQGIEQFVLDANKGIARFERRRPHRPGASRGGAVKTRMFHS